MSGKTFAKTYDPHSLEQRIYRRWEAHGYFAPAGNGPPYCIMIPPPNVTGSLHMGHAFQDTLMDALTRYHPVAGRYRPRRNRHANGRRAHARGGG